VLAGAAGVEQAAKAGRPCGDGALHAGPHGRLAGQTDVPPSPAGAGRGRLPQLPRKLPGQAPELALVDKAQLLTLTAPE
jgi:catalase (peroxidase I)